MMQAQRQISRENMRTIFGAYIMSTLAIPGREQTTETKEKEKEVFEMVDDYIEQA